MIHLLRQSVFFPTGLLVTNISLCLRVHRLSQSTRCCFGERHSEHHENLQECLHKSIIIPALHEERDKLLLHYAPGRDGDAYFPRAFVVPTKRPGNSTGDQKVPLIPSFSAVTPPFVNILKSYQG